MSYMTCDSCDGNTYTHDNPFVEFRVPRPSDKSDMCCTLAGHKKCFAPSTELPSIGETGGVATPVQWELWIESPEARKHGFCFLT
jgi:hypothetical protein